MADVGQDTGAGPGVEGADGSVLLVINNIRAITSVLQCMRTNNKQVGRY